MKLLKLLPLLLLLHQPLHAQDSLSKDSLLHVIEVLKANSADGSTPIYSDAERYRDSVLLARTTPGAAYEREKAEADRAWPWAMRGILLGAGVFVLWAFLYKKRYREMHTRNGVYIGIGSKYFHDHHETDHYAPGRYGARAEDDPWCYNEYWTDRSGRKQPPRNGGGASGSW
ncbi:MAG: hypothetical protein EOP50_01845 [Sphingobacteriales bacterium]|nr:MAG: hypothetical protein EOP50_01845 [Sphingobacteriales bacterium]